MIFIDTGAFLARYVANDQHHAQALLAWDELTQTRRRCFTSSFVLDETFTLLGRRAGYGFAAERARNILAAGTLEILRPEQRHEEPALSLFEKYADQQVSFTDCLSFILMRQSRIRKVFGFDRHFIAAGFELWPPRPAL